MNLNYTTNNTTTNPIDSLTTTPTTTHCPDNINSTTSTETLSTTTDNQINFSNNVDNEDSTSYTTRLKPTTTTISKDLELLPEYNSYPDTNIEESKPYSLRDNACTISSTNASMSNPKSSAAPVFNSYNSTGFSNTTSIGFDRNIHNENENNTHTVNMLQDFYSQFLIHSLFLHFKDRELERSYIVRLAQMTSVSGLYFFYDLMSMDIANNPHSMYRTTNCRLARLYFTAISVNMYGMGKLKAKENVTRIIVFEILALGLFYYVLLLAFGFLDLELHCEAYYDEVTSDPLYFDPLVDPLYFVLFVFVVRFLSGGPSLTIPISLILTSCFLLGVYIATHFAILDLMSPASAYSTACVIGILSDLAFYRNQKRVFLLEMYICKILSISKLDIESMQPVDLIKLGSNGSDNVDGVLYTGNWFNRKKTKRLKTVIRKSRMVESFDDEDDGDNDEGLEYARFSRVGENAGNVNGTAEYDCPTQQYTSYKFNNEEKNHQIYQSGKRNRRKSSVLVNWIQQTYTTIWPSQSEPIETQIPTSTNQTSPPPTTQTQKQSLLTQIKEGWNSELSLPHGTPESESYSLWRSRRDIAQIRITLLMLALSAIIHIPLDIITYCDPERTEKSPSLCLDDGDVSAGGSGNRYMVLMLRIGIICLPAVLFVLGTFARVLKGKLKLIQNYVFGCLLIECVGTIILFTQTSRRSDKPGYFTGNINYTINLFQAHLAGIMMSAGDGTCLDFKRYAVLCIITQIVATLWTTFRANLPENGKKVGDESGGLGTIGESVEVV
ncbi:hypothetical protein HDU76_002943 [Blyttiomyces sp. JEL0837]|nr:hypothetical protein HDU76_002943 [Blyttiomyces sp. JEL0837]